MVTLDDELHRRAKTYAARHATTLKALIEEALRVRLMQKPNSARSRRVSLPTFRGNGLQPGISLDDMSTVYDCMDSVR
jgi:hypothetical protein